MKKRVAVSLLDTCVDSKFAESHYAQDVEFDDPTVRRRQAFPD